VGKPSILYLRPLLQAQSLKEAEVMEEEAKS